MSDKIKALLKNKKALIAVIAVVIVAVIILGATGKLGTVLNLLSGSGEPAEATDPGIIEITTKAPSTESPSPTAAKIDENGIYYTKEDVAEYIYTYGKLPKNYITKDEAEALGWPGGGLDGYADGKMIGGDKFGNREGHLPKKSGRQYYECDIDTMHKNSRGTKRIVFSNDGLIYYTEDHYETFTLLYGQE